MSKVFDYKSIDKGSPLDGLSIPALTRIALARFAKNFSPPPTSSQTIGVVDGMSRFVSQNPHAPLLGPAFDFQHLLSLQTYQPRVSQIEGNGHSRNAIRREPIVG